MVGWEFGVVCEMKVEERGRSEGSKGNRNCHLLRQSEKKFKTLLPHKQSGQRG